ncbi:MAG: fused MFS/spermidine synthase [SAR324 cluster bacterium]|nr:fused MFS/spermidine synthase [SAR324 cluster bacterium]
MKLFEILNRSRPERLIWEKDISGVKVQVWEKEGRRELRFGNHIMQSVISTVKPDYLVLPYTQFMLLGLLFCPEPKNVLHLGLGGGSLVRWLHREFPVLQQTIIEINSGVIEAAHRHFDLPVDQRLNILHADASEIITSLTEKYDLIFLDAFGDYGASEEVKRVEFLRNLRCCLNSTGWLVGNLWTVTGDYEQRREQWGSTFNQLLEARANRKGNVILYGSQLSQLPEKQQFEATAKILQKSHRLDFKKMLCELNKVF